MSKKRSRNVSVYCSIEGIKRETIFLEYLKEVYSHFRVKFPENPSKGGTPDRIIDFAIRYQHYDYSFAWIDEDKDINQETREGLAKWWCLTDSEKENLLACPLKEIQARFNEVKRRNPILIVSQPICVDALILRVLGYDIPHQKYDIENRKKQIKDTKSALGGIFGGEESIDFYRSRLNKEILEIRRKEIPELNLLIEMISPKVS